MWTIVHEMSVVICNSIRTMYTYCEFITCAQVILYGHFRVWLISSADKVYWSNKMQTVTSFNAKCLKSFNAKFWVDGCSEFSCLLSTLLNQTFFPLFLANRFIVKIAMETINAASLNDLDTRSNLMWIQITPNRELLYSRFNNWHEIAQWENNDIQSKNFQAILGRINDKINVFVYQTRLSSSMNLN